METGNPELPAGTLSYGCYAYMFSGCISLTSMPKLPATSLAEFCYAYMFSGCEKLAGIHGDSETEINNKKFKKKHEKQRNKRL